MKINVKNYRGCESAELSLESIALVCGHNEAGKTSIAQAVAAALTRNGAPVDGIAKNAAKMLLRDGASRGNCRVGTRDGYAQANWPGASVSEDGVAPKASDIACGLVSMVDMKQADRSSLLIGLLDALPNKGELTNALHDVAPGRAIEAVWQSIEADGWDAAHKRARTKGAELKGAWEHITGEKWGAKKGEGWRPAVLGDIEPDTDTLQGALDLAKEQLEQAIASQAADGARREMLKEAANAACEDPEPYRKKAESAAAKIASLRDKLARLPRPQHGDGGDCKCPHCDGDLVIRNGVAVKPEAGLSDEINAARQADIQAATEEFNATSDEHADHMAAIHRCEQQANAAKRAADELAAMPDGSTTPEQIQQARDAVYGAEAMLRAAHSVQSAAERHNGIIVNQALTATLAPDGLRREVLSARLATFNGRLAALSKAGGWPTVEVADDLSVTYGGRPYVLLSASAQFRVRTTLQLAIAGIDGSDAAIIDAADILDKKGRNGLFGVVRAAKLRTLICMTLDDTEAVPDLKKAGMGQSYWIEGAVLVEV